MANRPDLEPLDRRQQVADVRARKQVDIPTSRLRLQHGRSRDNLMLHAPLQPQGGIPAATPTRALPETRRRRRLSNFVPEPSPVASGDIGIGLVPENSGNPAHSVPIDIGQGFRYEPPAHGFRME